MLTKEQKKLLEDKIYTIAKKRIMEWENKDDNSKNVDKEKLNTVLNWLNDDTVNQAAIAYELEGAETEEEKASARSIFYKKAKGEKNDNGVPYKFDNRELNTISSIMNNAEN